MIHYTYHIYKKKHILHLIIRSQDQVRKADNLVDQCVIGVLKTKVSSLEGRLS